MAKGLRRIALWVLSIMMLFACATASAEQPAWDEEVDVLIVGSGGAGLSAAVEAADAGAQRVLIIEKLGYMGGVTFMSQGILSGYETQVAKAADVHCTADQCYEQQIRESNYTIQADLTRITADECGTSIDWLIDEIGVPFKDVVDASVVYGPLPLLHYTEGGGAAFKEPFLKALEQRGVELRLNTKAVKLIGDEERNVVGVVAETKEGEIRIGAKAVVLATGGYANNTELIRRLHPQNDLYTGAGAPGSTGDAILMASEFGACIVNGDNVQCYMRDYDEVTSKVGSWTIYVGANGERFMNEKLITTTDNKAIMDAVKHRMHEDGVDYIWCINDQVAMDQYKPARPNGYDYVTGETLEDLASNMGVDAQTLTATIERWNSMVEKGVDEDFGRTRSFEKIEAAPFYAVKSRPGAVITYGGLLRNTKGEVVKVDGNTIPGLYVAGEAAAAANANGWTISHAITWGRIAGRNAGAYAMTK